MMRTTVKRRPLGLTFIITFYSLIGGLTLALSFFQLLSVNNIGMERVFIDLSLDFIAKNTILTREFLASLPERIMLLFSILVTFTTSLFHTLLANALFLNNSKAYLLGILFHGYSAFSAFALWMLGINTIKLIGVVLLIINLVKATYLYISRARLATLT